MEVIKLAGQSIPLRFSVSAVEAFEADVGLVSDFKEIISNPENWMQTRIKIIRVLGNGGYEYLGVKPDLTDEWVKQHITPGILRSMDPTIVKVVAEGMAMETEDDDAERDLVLEEIKKNRSQGN